MGLVASRVPTPLSDLRDESLAEAREMVGNLPVESAGVREHRSLVQDVSAESFWLCITPPRTVYFP